MIDELSYYSIDPLYLSKFGDNYRSQLSNNN